MEVKDETLRTRFGNTRPGYGYRPGPDGSAPEHYHLEEVHVRLITDEGGPIGSLLTLQDAVGQLLQSAIDAGEIFGAEIVLPEHTRCVRKDWMQPDHVELPDVAEINGHLDQRGDLVS